MNSLQVEHILNLGNIDGWTPSFDSMSGTLHWENEDVSGLGIYATPHWDKDGEVPFDVWEEVGDYEDRWAILKLNWDDNVEAQLDEYVKMLRSILTEYSNY
jgi:hypothetical protein